MHQEFVKEIIANERDTNDEIFWDCFKYQNPSSLGKDLIRATQAKNEQIVNNVNDGLIDLRNDTNGNEIPHNENPKKVVEIVEKMVDLKNTTQIKNVINNKKVKQLKY